MIKNYTVPMIGTIVNWETFSGDPNDPVRPCMLDTFSKNRKTSVRVSLVSVDFDNGEMDVRVEAEKPVHIALENFLKNSPEDIILGGRSRLIIPEGETRPKVFLKSKSASVQKTP